jgi:transcriptional regulator with XRE-family HTH domain
LIISLFYVDIRNSKRRQYKMLILTPGQCRAARALINWTQPKLAEKAGFGLSTIVDYERERRVVSERAIERMTETLQAAGVEFIAENGGGAGVRLKTKKA